MNNLINGMKKISIKPKKKIRDVRIIQKKLMNM